jgi:hypothetical protein
MFAFQRDSSLIFIIWRIFCDIGDQTRVSHMLGKHFTTNCWFLNKNHSWATVVTKHQMAKDLFGFSKNLHILPGDGNVLPITSLLR